MLSENFLNKSHATFSSARRLLYSLGLQPRNNSRTLWEDVDGSWYEITNNGEFAIVLPFDILQKED